MNYMVSVSLILFTTPCANLPSSLATKCFQNILCWSYLVRCRYSIADPVSVSKMALVNCCYWPGGAVPSDLYWTSVTPRPENRWVSSFYVKVSIMSISSCGMILIFFSHALYCVVQAYGMLGAGVLGVPTLGYGSLIIRATLGGSGVSTIGGSVSLTLCSGDVCTNLGGVPGLFRWVKKRG